MANERAYTSRRAGITTALAEALSKIDGRGLYKQSVAETSPRLSQLVHQKYLEKFLLLFF